MKNKSALLILVLFIGSLLISGEILVGSEQSNTSITKPDSSLNVRNNARIGEYNGNGSVESDPQNCLNFDGSNDFVSIPDGSQINFGTSTDFTLEAWVKLYGSQPNYTGIIAKADNNGWVGYQLVIVENKIAAEICNGPAFAGIGEGLWGTTNLYDGSWHHLAMAVTRSTSNVKLYVDGEVEANVTHSAFVSNIDNSGNMLLGTDRATAKYFNGSIDEVRVWNTARSSEDINNYKSVEVDPASTGLVAYYRLNQGTAGGDNSTITYAIDATSYANNGTLNNFALIGETSNWILANNSELPVELVSFTASLNSGFIELKWQTATEVNNYGFNVECRMNNEEWKAIGFVEGNGNSNSLKEYSFTDKDVTEGKYCYRLKQINTDGSFSYSKEAEVNIESLPTEFALYQNYPNPFNPVTTINYQLPTSGHVTLKVYDMLGREVAILVDEFKQSGMYNSTFSTLRSSLSSGVYFYTLQCGNFRETKKLLLVK